MALVIDGVSVVIANAVVEARFPGGLASYERECPNATYFTDGQISRVGFMVEADAKAFTKRLERYGIVGPWAGGPSDVAIIIAQDFNDRTGCDWLEADCRDVAAADGRRARATIAWLRGTDPDAVVVPPGWEPEALQFLSMADLRDHYEFMEVKPGDGGRVETYRHRATGQLIYVARPEIRTASSLQTRYVELMDELNALGGRPLGVGRRQALLSVAERAKQLVEDSEAKLPGALLLQSTAARLLEDWELAAASARALTVLCPDLLEGWMNLTWALAMLNRLDEAESSARRAVALDAGSAPALGNLASVLLQRGDFDDAFTTIERAMEIDPSDTMNQAIRERICNARARPLGTTLLRWYQRLW